MGVEWRIVQSAVFSLGECHDNKFWEVLISLLRNLVVMAQEPCDFEGDPQNASDLIFFCGWRSEKPCDFCSGMVASPSTATVVIRFCNASFVPLKVAPKSQRKNPPSLQNTRHRVNGVGRGGVKQFLTRF